MLCVCYSRRTVRRRDKSEGVLRHRARKVTTKASRLRDAVPGGDRFDVSRYPEMFVDVSRSPVL